ncbi:GspH/FimT family pseudopilin [Thalassotalea psychrophila]|uniref:Type II secretion system protein H n=1 Tax=Thalassotalea psychrophila TaxID=3065647 RepID=A0ABY9TX16_9GAMM|nr:GspH/FimT family pseudopilin [Colwelliaceae bacterium SQ149]
MINISSHVHYLHRKKNGFSLIELMVTIAIMSSLFTIGMPSYNDLIQRYHIKTEVDKWLLVLNHARQAAITSGNIITLCPSGNGFSCGKYWHEGAILFIDNNRDHRKDNNEVILEVVEASNKQQVLTWRAFQNRNYIQFQQNGFTWNQNGTLRVCSDDPSLKYNRALIVTRSGRIRLSTDSDGNGIHEDAAGDEVSC